MSRWRKWQKVILWQTLDAERTWHERHPLDAERTWHEWYCDRPCKDERENLLDAERIWHECNDRQCQDERMIPLDAESTWRKYYDRPCQDSWKGESVRCGEDWHIDSCQDSLDSWSRWRRKEWWLLDAGWRIRNQPFNFFFLLVLVLRKLMRKWFFF